MSFRGPRMILSVAAVAILLFATVVAPAMSTSYSFNVNKVIFKGGDTLFVYGSANPQTQVSASLRNSHGTTVAEQTVSASNGGTYNISLFTFPVAPTADITVGSYSVNVTTVNGAASRTIEYLPTGTTTTTSSSATTSSSTGQTTTTSTSTTGASVQKQIQELNATVISLTATLNQLRDQINKQPTNATEIQQAITSLQGQINTLRSNIASLSNMTAGIVSSVNILQQRVNAQGSGGLQLGPFYIPDSERLPLAIGVMAATIAAAGLIAFFFMRRRNTKPSGSSQSQPALPAGQTTQPSPSTEGEQTFQEWFADHFGDFRFPGQADSAISEILAWVDPDRCILKMSEGGMKQAFTAASIAEVPKGLRQKGVDLVVVYDTNVKEVEGIQVLYIEFIHPRAPAPPVRVATQPLAEQPNRGTAEVVPPQLPEGMAYCSNCGKPFIPTTKSPNLCGDCFILSQFRALTTPHRQMVTDTTALSVSEAEAAPRTSPQLASKPCKTCGGKTYFGATEGNKPGPVYCATCGKLESECDPATCKPASHPPAKSHVPKQKDPRAYLLKNSESLTKLRKIVARPGLTTDEMAKELQVSTKTLFSWTIPALVGLGLIEKKPDKKYWPTDLAIQLCAELPETAETAAPAPGEATTTAEAGSASASA